MFNCLAAESFVCSCSSAHITRSTKAPDARPQGPEEMCLSLEYKNPSKTSEKMCYFDRVTFSLHILHTANQETEVMPRSPFGRRGVRQRGYGLRLLIFKMANNKVDLGQIRSEEIVYSRFIKIPLG